MTWIDVATIVAVPAGLILIIVISFLGIDWAVRLMEK